MALPKLDQTALGVTDQEQTAQATANAEQPDLAATSQNQSNAYEASSEVDDAPIQQAKPRKKHRLRIILGWIFLLAIICGVAMKVLPFDSTSMADSTETVPAVRAFNSKSIWYHYNAKSISRTSSVDHIMVFDGDGKVTTYQMPDDITFDNVHSKNFDTTLNFASQQDRRSFDIERDKAIQALDLDNLYRVRDNIKNEYAARTYVTALAKNVDGGKNTTYFSLSGNGELARQSRISSPGSEDKLRRWSEQQLRVLNLQIKVAELIRVKLQHSTYRAPQPAKFRLAMIPDPSSDQAKVERLAFPFGDYDATTVLRLQDHLSDIETAAAQNIAPEAVLDRLLQLSHDTESTSYYATQSLKWADDLQRNTNSMQIDLRPSRKQPVFDMLLDGYSSLATKVGNDFAGFTLDNATTGGAKVH